MFKPLIPVIKDIYAHTFGEAIHLATVHAKYGSHHLDKALAKEADNSKDQKADSASETYAVHVNAPECVFNFQPYKIEANYSFLRLYQLTTIFISILIPPPKH